MKIRQVLALFSVFFPLPPPSFTTFSSLLLYRECQYTVSSVGRGTPFEFSEGVLIFYAFGLDLAITFHHL